MKATHGNVPPVVRFTEMLLYEATIRKVDEIRICLSKNEGSIFFDGKCGKGPPLNVFPMLIKQILRLANVTVWPWRRTVSRRQLDMEFESDGLSSSWVLESSNLDNELVLKRKEGVGYKNSSGGK